MIVTETGTCHLYIFIWPPGDGEGAVGRSGYPYSYCLYSAVF